MHIWMTGRLLNFCHKQLVAVTADVTNLLSKSCVFIMVYLMNSLLAVGSTNVTPPLQSPAKLILINLPVTCRLHFRYRRHTCLCSRRRFSPSAPVTHDEILSSIRDALTFSIKHVLGCLEVGRRDVCIVKICASYGVWISYIWARAEILFFLTQVSFKCQVLTQEAESGKCCRNHNQNIRDGYRTSSWSLRIRLSA